MPILQRQDGNRGVGWTICGTAQVEEAMTKLTAPQLYAQSQSRPCSGDDKCYWCGAPCDRRVPHGVPKAEVGTKSERLAKHPSSAWICHGCNLFRRPLITVRYFGGGFIDRRCPMDHSWLITEQDALALKWCEAVYKVLLDPPLRFSLTWIDPGEKNHLQLAEVNDFQEIKANTSLVWMLNNKLMTYSVYELDIALRQGLEGREPGVRELIRRLGPVKAESLVETPEDEASVGITIPVTSQEPPKRKRGRPSTRDVKRDEAKAATRTIKTLVSATPDELEVRTHTP